MTRNPLELTDLVRGLPPGAQGHLAKALDVHIRPLPGRSNGHHKRVNNAKRARNGTKTAASASHASILTRLAEFGPPELNDIEDFARYLYRCARSNASRRVRKDSLSNWSPTSFQVIDAALRLAEVGPGDVVYDLGCGDGRVVSRAARVFGAGAVGFDIDPKMVVRARRRARRLGLVPQVRIRKQSMVAIPDLYAATVVYLYLPQSTVNQIMPVLLRRCTKGARLVAVNMWPANWAPAKKMVVATHAGRWRIGVWVI